MVIWFWLIWIMMMMTRKMMMMILQWKLLTGPLFTKKCFPFFKIWVLPVVNLWKFWYSLYLPESSLFLKYEGRAVLRKVKARCLVFLACNVRGELPVHVRLTQTTLLYCSQYGLSCKWTCSIWQNLQPLGSCHGITDFAQAFNRGVDEFTSL